MNEIERIEQQLKLAFEGGAWHGPGVLETLEGVTAKQAAAHPVAGAHSIWELVVHIAAWEDACRRRLGGDRAELSTAEDWPPITDTTRGGLGHYQSRADRRSSQTEGIDCFPH